METQHYCLLTEGAVKIKSGPLWFWGPAQNYPYCYSDNSDAISVIVFLISYSNNIRKISRRLGASELSLCLLPFDYWSISCAHPMRGNGHEPLHLRRARCDIQVAPLSSLFATRRRHLTVRVSLHQDPVNV